MRPCVLCGYQFDTTENETSTCGDCWSDYAVKQAKEGEE
jgi:predicted Zn-ribbon and HTH transcriptional regulator